MTTFTRTIRIKFYKQNDAKLHTKQQQSKWKNKKYFSVEKLCCSKLIITLCVTHKYCVVNENDLLFM